jgi:hypothetical protein
MPTLYPPVTPESVAAAKADAQAIRDQLRLEHGLVIADDGTVTMLRNERLALDIASGLNTQHRRHRIDEQVQA